MEINISYGNIVFCCLLTLLFIGLKLTHYIDWPWLWVLAPLLVPLAFLAVVVITFFVVAIIGSFIGGRR